MIFLYTTHKNKEEAEKITSLLLEKRLIACVNYFPIEACLIWQGQKTSENEVVALYKTSTTKAVTAEQVILEHHPYEVPCIIHIEAKANASYEDWVKETTS
ncbi:MAG: divalent-cation tolerance protein CutA [Candidatus Paceibacterota bacterium]